MEKYLDIDYLKSNCSMIHYFGLGFIQIKLGPEHRVHVYTDKFEATVGDEDVHNHRRNFVSRILGGALYQEIFEVEKDENGRFFMVQESCQPKSDGHVPAEAVRVSVTPVYEKTFLQGDSYYIDHNTFHRVASIDAITHVRQSDYKKLLADVVYPFDHTLTCPFSTKIEEAVLWDVVRERLRSV